MAINSPLNIAAQPGKTRLRKSLKLWQVVRWVWPISRR